MPICILSIGQSQPSANIYIGTHLWTRTSVTICIRKHLWTKTSESIGIGTYIWPTCLTPGNPHIQGLWLLSALEPGNFLLESGNSRHSYLMHRHSFRISVGEAQTSVTICIRKHLWIKTSVTICIRNLFVLGASVTICIREHLWTKTS